MGKIKDICKVCESRKLINFARLCKKCNRSKAGVQVKNEVLKTLVAKADETAKEQELEAAQAAGRNKVEETTEEVVITEEPTKEEKKE